MEKPKSILGLRMLGAIPAVSVVVPFLGDTLQDPNSTVSWTKRGTTMETLGRVLHLEPASLVEER